MKSAQDIIMALWASGYAATDIIQTLFKVMKQLILLELLCWVVKKYYIITIT